MIVTSIPRSPGRIWIVRRSGSDGGPARRKQRITISLDANLIEYFKTKAGKRGYQTLINETLRRATEREELEDALRRILREELRHEPRYDNA